MKQYKRRVFEIIQIGKDQDIESIAFDLFIYEERHSRQCGD